MTVTRCDYGLHEPRMQDAIAELKALVRGKYPDAVFEVFPSGNVGGSYMRIIVDADDPDDATALIIDRVAEMQIDDELPLYPMTIRTAERRRADTFARVEIDPAAPQPTETPAVPH